MDKKDLTDSIESLGIQSEEEYERIKSELIDCGDSVSDDELDALCYSIKELRDSIGTLTDELSELSQWQLLLRTLSLLGQAVEMIQLNDMIVGELLKYLNEMQAYCSNIDEDEHDKKMLLCIGVKTHMQGFLTHVENTLKESYEGLI